MYTIQLENGVKCKNDTSPLSQKRGKYKKIVKLQTNLKEKKKRILQSENIYGIMIIVGNL